MQWRPRGCSAKVLPGIAVLIACLLPQLALTHFHIYDSHASQITDKNHHIQEHVPRKTFQTGKIGNERVHNDGKQGQHSAILPHGNSQYGVQPISSHKRVQFNLQANRQKRGLPQQHATKLYHRQTRDISKILDGSHVGGKHPHHHEKYRRHSEKKKNMKKHYDGSYDYYNNMETEYGSVNHIPQNSQPSGYKWYKPGRPQVRDNKQYDTQGYGDYGESVNKRQAYDGPIFLYRTVNMPQPRIGMAFRQLDEEDQFSDDSYWSNDDAESSYQNDGTYISDDEDDEGSVKGQETEDDIKNQYDEDSDDFKEQIKKSTDDNKPTEKPVLYDAVATPASHMANSDSADVAVTFISRSTETNKGSNTAIMLSDKTEDKVPIEEQHNKEDVMIEAALLSVDDTDEKAPDVYEEAVVVTENNSTGNVSSESKLSYRSPMYVDFRVSVATPLFDSAGAEPDTMVESKPEPEHEPEPEAEESVAAEEDSIEIIDEKVDTEYSELPLDSDEKGEVESEIVDNGLTNPESPDPEEKDILEPFDENEVNPEAESENEVDPEGSGNVESEPEAEPPPEPTNEPTRKEKHTVPEAEASNPEEETGFDIEYDSPVYAEPEPDWDTAKRIWGPAWEVHIYGVGIGFAVIAGYSCFSLLRLWKHKNLLSQGYFVSLNIIMLFMGFFRAMYFLIDGYNSNATFHPVGAYFLLSIGFPCITSAFSILFLALLQSTKMQVLTPKIQSTPFLVSVIVFHFALSITADIVVGYFYSAEALLFVCQVATVLWGLFLFGGYIYIFRKLYVAAMWRQKEMMRQMLAKIKLNGITPITKTPKLTLNIAIRVTLLTSMLGLIMAALMIYGMAGVYSIFSHSIPDPWPWWGFKFGLRLIELAMAATMSYVATQPFRYNQPMCGKKWQWSGLFYLAPCKRLCECDQHDCHDDDLDWEELPGDDLSNHVDNRNENLVNQVLCNPEETMPMTQQNGHAPIRLQRDSPDINKNKPASRPASLLVNDNGFVRFRETGEVGGEVLISTDDELDALDNTSPLENPFVAELKRNGLINKNVDSEYYYIDKAPDKFSDPLLDPPSPDYYMGSVPLTRRLATRTVSIDPDIDINTPGTPRSFYSAQMDFDCASSMWSFRPPSSIHLRDSIDNALDIPGFGLRTPDYLNSPLNTPSSKMFLYKLRDRFSRHKSMSSFSDLQSLSEYQSRHYIDSRNSIDVSSTGYCTPEEVDAEFDSSESTLKSTKSPLYRSCSDSIGSVFHDPYMYTVERRRNKDLGRGERDTGYEGTMQMQDLMQDINDMCSAIGDFATDKCTDITPV